MKAIREEYTGICEKLEVQVLKATDDIIENQSNAVYYRKGEDNQIIYYVEWNTQFDEFECFMVDRKYKINRKYYEERMSFLPITWEEIIGEEKEDESDNQIESNSELQQSASDSQTEAI